MNIKRLMMWFSQKITSKKYKCNSLIIPILLSSTILSNTLVFGLYNHPESISISEPAQVKTFHQEMNTVMSALSVPEKKVDTQEQQSYSVQDLVYKESSEDIIETYPLQCGFITTTVNVRKAPSLDSEVLGIFGLNSEVEFYEYSDEWCKISLGGEDAYIYRQYISSEPVPYDSFPVSGDERKSFMDYTSITSRNSRQYKIQESKAYTGETGIRMVNDRYLIALGSHFSNSVGQYIDLVLENGTVIPCILGDCKADKDTVNDHCQGVDGSTAEFIIQTSSLSSGVKHSGDCSNTYDSWNSPVVEIRIYGKNLFD